MDRVTLDGIELEFETRGAGEPVVLLHAGVFTGFSLSLLEQPALTERHRVVHYHRAGDKAGAMDTFLRGTCGPDYRPVLDRVLPGAFDRAVADADTLFGQQLPALQQWSFSGEDGTRITQPVLAVVGAISQQLDPIWKER